MEYDILTKLADLIGSQMKEFMTTNEEIKELQYALDKTCNIANKLKFLADNFKTKVDREEVNIVDFKNFQDEFIQNIHEMTDEINYIIALFNSLSNKNVLDLSKIDINETYAIFYKTLNDLDAIEKSFDVIPE